MNPHRKAFKVDLLVFLACCFMLTWYLGFEMGRANQAKTCAQAQGQQVVSTTQDTCTYASAYGRATRTRRAI